MRNSHVLVLLFLSLCCFSQESTPLFIHETQSQQQTLYARHHENVKSADFYQVNSLLLDELVANKPNLVTFDISENGQTFRLELTKTNPLAADYIVRDARGNKLVKADVVHYRGYVKGDNRSLVAFSFSKGFVMGLVLNSQGNYVFGNVKNTDGEQYVFYNDRNLKLKNPYRCGTNDEKHFLKDTHQESSRSGSATGCKKVRIYIEADYSTFQEFFNVPATETFMTSMFNVVAAIYYADGMQLEISELRVWDQPSPYDIADTFYGSIQTFGDYIQNNFNGDLAHLYATYNSAGGVGWIHALCSTYDPFEHSGPYSFGDGQAFYNDLPVYSWTVNLVAHELGHNLGSRHTHYCGWELSPGVFGAIDSCYMVEEDSMGFNCNWGNDVPRIGTVMSYCHLSDGVDLNLGFGPIPAAKLRHEIQYASCLPASSLVQQPLAVNYGPYCVGDTIVMRVSNYTGGTISWTGPNGYSSTDSVVTILADNMNKKGIYSALVANDTCDAIDTTFVEIINPPPVSAINYYTGNILQPALMGAGYSYQWFCNGVPIAGAVLSSYTADTSGAYTVEIANAAGCKAMSLAYTIALTGLNGPEIAPAKIYKSPSGADLIIELYEKPCSGNVEFKLSDVTGRLLAAQSLDCSYSHALAIGNLPAGVYIAQLFQSGKLKLTHKILKN